MNVIYLFTLKKIIIINVTEDARQQRGRTRGTTSNMHTPKTFDGTATRRRRGGLRGGVGDNMSCGEEDRGKKRKTWLCGKEKDKIVKDTERSKRRKYEKWEGELEERIDSKQERLGIGTWTVRSLNETGRL